MSASPSSPTVMLGLSGGVDSSVAAWLLKESGYRVIAVFMKNWTQSDTSQTERACQSDQDLADAQAAADHLRIPLQVVNFAQTYWDTVFTAFLNTLAQGRTPNPDILCNTYVKFRAFLDYAQSEGADHIATGHYARIQRHKNGIHALLTAKDTQKDQTYFLHALNQSQLAYALFPLGEWQKPDVRALARKIGLNNHSKKDSTGICFIGEKKFNRFLKDFVLCQPGPIRCIDDNSLLGTHDGLMFYTIGQRQGLGIGGYANKPDLPWYVVKKTMETRTVWVAQGQHHPALFSDHCLVSPVHWIAHSPPVLVDPSNTPSSSAIACQVKLRHRHTQQRCTLTCIDETQRTYRVAFDQPQRAVAPGQYAVFYQGDTCLGGGAIL